MGADDTAQARGIPQPSPATCPRCHSRFRCGIGGDAPCACTTVSLPADTQAALRKAWIGCLCLECLRELALHPERAALTRKDGSRV